MDSMKKIFMISSILLCSFCTGKKEKSIPTDQQELILSENVDRINLNSYTFNAVDGSEEKITLEPGKKYVLDFWYLECMPCVRDHKLISKKIDSLSEKNIEVIGLSIDRNQKEWQAYLSKHEYAWKNFNQYFQEPNLKDDMKLKLYPSYFLVDTEGKVHEKAHSFKKILAYLSNEE